MYGQYIARNTALWTGLVVCYVREEYSSLDWSGGLLCKGSTYIIINHLVVVIIVDKKYLQINLMT